jgi:hydrophobic/amphiphilic exporter-1 (mainly G- bacteria), HAE1 family
MGLTRAAIARPIFILMLMLGAFLMGTIAYRSMRVELQPDVSFGVISVTTVYPGAGPDEINELITRRIEEAISGVSNLRELTSSSQEGFSNVIATFEIGSDVEVAANEVRSRIDAIGADLPREAMRPQIYKFDQGAEPVLTLAFTSKALSNRELRDLLDDRLRDRFAQITGVASVNVSGGDVREIRVEVDKDRLLAYGIGIVDVQRQLQAASLNAPAGRIVTGDREYTVRVPSQFESVDEIRDMVIRVSDPVNPMAKARSVRLGDIATVSDSVAERRTYSRLDGRDSVILQIQKAREGNAIRITEDADAIVGQVEKEYAAQGVEVTKTFAVATQIRESIADLNFALLFGIFLVSAIVFVFLHNMRGTIIVSLAIPTSIFATFIAMYIFGFTINNMSMLALSLAVGVLVDDAIVVLENIYRHLKLGENPRDAAINGRSEIGLAAIAITLADVVVFLPIAFMGGIVGQFFKPLALGFVVAVLFSLFVSFTLTPMLASRWYRAGEDIERPTGRFATWFERGFHRLERGYRRTLEWSLAHRWFVFILGNISLVAVFMFIGGGFASKGGGLLAAFRTGMPLFMVAMFVGLIVMAANMIRTARRNRLDGARAPILRPRYVLYGALFGLMFPIAGLMGGLFAGYKQEDVFKFGFLPQTDAGLVSISVQLPPGASLAATQEVVSGLEEKAMEHPDVKYVVSSVGTLGSNWSGTTSGANYAQISVTLHERIAFMDRLLMRGRHEQLRVRSADSVAADLLESVGRVPGADVKIAASDSFGFGSPIQMSFASDDRELLLATVTNIRNNLQEGAIRGVINPDVSSKPGKPEIRVRPDRVLLADYGLDVATVASTARTLYQGNNDAKYRVNGREYDINVLLADADRNDPTAVAGVPLRFVEGSPVYLGAVATLDEAPGIDKIERRDRQEEVRLTTDLLPGFAPGSVQTEIDGWIARENLVPEGVRIVPLGQAQAMQREMGYLFGALFLGLLLVYMLLASLYDNLLYPFIIQLAQPQAMVGALLALIIFDKQFTLVSFIGIITLVGLVGKNAILLVDYTNTLRARGRSRHDAIVEAGPVRLRPILMTSLALIVGMLPVATAIGRGSEFRETIGLTIIGGITLSTVLTLLVIPCSYTIFDDVSEGIGKLFGRRRDGEPPQGLTEGDTESESHPAPVGV